MQIIKLGHSSECVPNSTIYTYHASKKLRNFDIHKENCDDLGLFN